jgi:hypothetical protein
LEESFSTSDPVLDIFEDLEDSRIDPVLNIFEDLVNGSDIQNRPVQEKERAKNFSLKVLEKMFEEKILEVSSSLEVKKMIEQTLFQQVLNVQANTSIEGELLFQ